MTTGPPDSAIGRSLGRYVLERQLGGGAFGIVYVARHEDLGVRRAVKVLQTRLADQERFRAQFLREARLAATLDHPHVVRIYDYGVADDTPYIVMDMIEGHSMATRLTQVVHPGLEVAGWVSEIADALDYAHAQGIVHRDLKPANVLVRDRDESAVLVDFGIARLEAESATQTMAAIGTYAYMAPEQCVADGVVDRRTDLYAFAVMLYEIATGRPPFGTGVAAVAGHLEREPPSARAHNPYLPAEVDKVLGRGLAKAPDARYQRAEQLAADFLEAMGLRNAFAGVSRPPSVPQARPSRRYRRLLLSAGLAAVLVIAVTGVAFASMSGYLPLGRLLPGGVTTPSPPSLATATPFARSLTGEVGKPTDLRDATITVVQVDPHHADTSLYKAGPGNRLVTFEVLYENTSSNVLVYDPGQWRLVDATGQAFPVGPFWDQGLTGLGFGSIGPAGRARGGMYAIVPESATGLTLELNVRGQKLSVPLQP